MGGKGTLARMCLLALLWGSSFLWIKLALRSFSPGQIALGRIILGAAVLFALTYAGRKRLPRGRRTWAYLTVAAFFGSALPFFLFGLGEKTIDSGLAGVLNATTPLWALLIAVVFRMERNLFSLKMLGLLLGFVGVLVIFAPWQAHGLASWGSLAVLAAAASYAVAYTCIGRAMTGSGVAPIALSAGQLLIGTGMSALMLPIDGFGPITIQPVSALAVLILGLFGTGFAFALNYRLIADVGAVTATSVGYLLPVVSVLLGAVALHEAITVRVVIGMVVVLVGVGLTRWQPRQRPADEIEITPAVGQRPSETVRNAISSVTASSRDGMRTGAGRFLISSATVIDPARMCRRPVVGRSTVTSSPVSSDS
ncbi:DMT family transporter [Actinocrispum wychmicini]|uniref:Drug/metabolite transporter (DMT)-like permease n=1 Tax=Actinocrispum wychmicini TaxID=1213861 RepID=A0A4V2S8W3_9PSEU|nr:EamA family transporter [Actinocrispum wychmicini]TCO65450.1 drug/metabolite transporter (DMT)-like permease [Actinocrispum wychmicini]